MVVLAEWVVGVPLEGYETDSVVGEKVRDEADGPVWKAVALYHFPQSAVCVWRSVDPGAEAECICGDREEIYN